MAVTARASAVLRRERLWTPNFVFTLASIHLFFLAWAMLFSTLPLYVDRAPEWQIGWVVGGAFGVASLAVRPWSGRVVDRTGRWRSMVVGAACTGLLMAAHALTDNVALLTPIRFAYAVAAAFYTTAGMAMLADVLPASRRGEGMGWYGVIYTTTNVYGPWLGLALADAFGLRAFFACGGVVLLACAAVSALIREDRRPSEADGPPAPLLNRPALLPTGGFLALTIAFSVLPAFLVLYARQRELGNAGLFFFFMGLALVAARGTGGAMADRFGRAAVILPGFVLSAAGMALLAFAPGPGVFYLAAAVFGLGFGLGHTGLTIVTMDRAPAAERGAAMATFVIAWDIGTLGVFLLGFVGDAISLRALFAATAALPLVAMVWFEAMRRREGAASMVERREEPAPEHARPGAEAEAAGR